MDIITIETLRKQVYAAHGEEGFDGYDAMKTALEECRANGLRVVSRKSPRSMRMAVKRLLASPEYELTREQKIEILNLVMGDLIKEKSNKPQGEVR